MEIRIPALGESITEGDVSRWLKRDGDAVAAGEPVLELATDKATMEIAAESAGILRLVVPEGATVTVGQVVARVEAGSATSAVTAPAAPPPRPSPAPVASGRVTAPAASPPSVASPVASLALSAPTTRAPKPEPSLAARAPEAGTRRERMTRLRKSTAERLVLAQHVAAILTTFNEVDMTAALALRASGQAWFVERFGVKLGFMSIFGRAVVAALRAQPLLNASIDGEDIVHRDHVHLGIAVQTDRGLVVPVVRNAHALGLGALEREIQRLAGLARDGKLALDDLSGGTFTISNGGVYGSLLSTPILNPPQSGILGMHAIQQRPVTLADGSVATRPMMYLALSYDHRLIDGRQAVEFLVQVKRLVEDPMTRLLLA